MLGPPGEPDVGGDFARVERLGTARGDEAKRRRIVAVDDAAARPPRFALGVVEKLARRRVGPQELLFCKLGVELRRNGEAFFGERYGALEKLAPGQAAVASMSELKHAQHARHADRAAPDRSFEELQRLSLRIEEAIGPCGG